MSSAPRFAAHLLDDLAPEDFRHVMNLLREELARLTEVLEVAARAGDATTFRKAAHGIAGSSGAAGAEELEQAARRAMTRPADGLALEVMATEVRALADAVLIQIDGALTGTHQL
jgi:HPt (histidine-containing phosphotransfer) domain-containing protein